jgi:hypothetical protein
MFSILLFLIGFLGGFMACYFTRKKLAQEFHYQTPQYDWQKTEPAEFLDQESDIEKITKALNQ